jgi:hypothetical protein
MSDHIKRGKQVELLDALQVERARYVEQRSASRALPKSAGATPKHVYSSRTG